MSGFELGQPVRFSTHLVRRTSRRGENLPKKVWSQTDYFGNDLPGGVGIIIGKRKLSNGDREWYDEAGYIYLPKSYFDAYLVAYDLRRKPVHVLPEHLQESS